MFQVAGNSLQSAEHAYRSWLIIVPAKTTREDLLKPSAWAHIASKLRPLDKIRVVSEDHSFEAELVVRFARKIEASVGVLHWTQIEGLGVGAIKTDEYEIRHAGHKAKWRILRGTEVIRDGFETDQQAKAWLADHIQRLAA